MKLFYKPFSILGHQIAGRLGRTAFAALWERVGGGDPPPKATAGRVGLVRLATATALEAATMAAAGAIVEQLTARFFHNLLGAWPEKPKAAGETATAAAASASV
jgi:hypothetical protein